MSAFLKESLISIWADSIAIRNSLELYSVPIKIDLRTYN